MKTLQKILVALLFISTQAILLADSPSGQVISWGEYAPNTASLKSITNVVAVSGGFSYGLALLNDRTVFGWGSNMAGQIMSILSDKTNGLVVDGKGLSNIVAVSAGVRHSLALKADGHVVAWGDNSVGQTNIPAQLTNAIAISAGNDYSLALKKDGTVIGWGMTRSPVELSSIVAIAASQTWGGGDLALKNDGTVLEWDNRNGRPAVLSGISNIVAIAAGSTHGLLLTKDKTVIGVGGHPGGFGEAIIPPGLTNIVAVAAGNEFSLALKEDGTVVAWGRNWFHETNVPAGLTNVVAIAAGNTFCLAITTNAAVVEKFRQNGGLNLIPTRIR